MIAPATRAAIEAALGTPLGDTDACAGGDINQAHRVSTARGETLFVKTNDAAPARIFACEARGLEWLRAAEALPLPRVIAVSDETADHGFLVLEYLAPTRRAADFDEQLGRGLARLHRAGADRFGLGYDNYLATLEQPNQRVDDAPSWSAFYAERRLAPMLEHAIASGGAPSGWRRRFAALRNRLPDLLDDSESPSRVHGDLWSGNVHTTGAGGPCLIDPAVYGGHREIDLAMLDLFGGLSATTLAAYDEAWPLADGFRDRLPLHQLYPLLVHVALFGGGYLASVERVLTRYGD